MDAITSIIARERQMNGQVNAEAQVVQQVADSILAATREQKTGVDENRQQH